MIPIERTRSELDAVQRWFQAVVTHPGGVDEGAASEAAQRIARLGRDELEAMVLRSPTLTAHDRIAIYANAYYARMLECMAESFPVFRKAVGDEIFNDFAFGYLQDCPPTSYSLDHLADQFSEFLDRSRPAEDAAGSSAARWSDFLVDLTRLEWTIAQVFDGPGIEGRSLPGPESLGTLRPEVWRGSRLEMAPCLRLLACRYPVNAYYTRARSDQSGLGQPMPRDTWVAISRRDFVVRRFDLERGEYLLLDALCAGSCVEEAIARCADHSSVGDAVLAKSLDRWFRRGAIEGFFLRVLPE